MSRGSLYMSLWARLKLQFLRLWNTKEMCSLRAMGRWLGFARQWWLLWWRRRQFFESQAATDLIEWKSEYSGNVPLTTDTSFKSLHNPNIPIHHDVVIYNSENEQELVEDDPDRRSRAHEFAIMNTFQLNIVKNSRRTTASWIENCMWRVHTSFDKGAKSFTIEKFSNENTCNMSISEKNHRQAKCRCRIMKD